jgi:hypothetical protein
MLTAVGGRPTCAPVAGTRRCNPWRGTVGTGYKRRMRRALRIHPDCRRDAVSRIDVEITREPEGSLLLQYRTTGLPKLPPLPAPVIESMRADDLWRHTCFEVFARPFTSDAYYEFNFSPDLFWAAYRFDGYRRNRCNAELERPSIQIRTDGGRLELDAAVRLGTLKGLAGSWRLGLSAVIEDESGRISYWALNHPPGKPDFHHADAFALELQT